jgi:hypothetical protein
MIMVHGRTTADDESGHGISEQAICKDRIARPAAELAILANTAKISPAKGISERQA